MIAVEDLEQQEANPLLEGLQVRATPDPCVLVIFGASGDLAHKKLMPALYSLMVRRLMPPRFAIVGVSRGVTAAQIRNHEERRADEVLWQEPGLAYRCSLCERPAVTREWMWQRIFRGLLPLFPRPAYLCAVHRRR